MLDEEEEGYAIGTVLLSYHHLASIDLTSSVVLVSCLVLWLKRSIVPSASKMCLTLKDLYLAILLASRQSSSLLLAIVCRIHRESRAFC